jgi:AP2 domain
MACICVRGLVPEKLNFPTTDYSTHAPMLTGMAIDELAKQLRTQAGATGTRQEKITQYQGIRGKQSGGVSSGKWEAIIRVAGRSVYLGMYDTDKEAAQAYDQAAILRWAQGVGATSHADSSTTQPSLNFPLEDYQRLLAELDSNGERKETTSSSLDSTAPVLLGKRYAEAVLQVCRQFLATSETLKNALA